MIHTEIRCDYCGGKPGRELRIKWDVFGWPKVPHIQRADLKQNGWRNYGGVDVCPRCSARGRKPEKVDGKWRPVLRRQQNNGGKG